MPDEPRDDDSPTAGAELDWDLEDRDRFLADADPDYVAPVTVIVEADE